MRRNSHNISKTVQDREVSCYYRPLIGSDGLSNSGIFDDPK